MNLGVLSFSLCMPLVMTWLGVWWVKNVRSRQLIPDEKFLESIKDIPYKIGEVFAILSLFFLLTLPFLGLLQKNGWIALTVMPGIFAVITILIYGTGFLSDGYKATKRGGFHSGPGWIVSFNKERFLENGIAAELGYWEYFISGFEGRSIKGRIDEERSFEAEMEISVTEKTSLERFSEIVDSTEHFVIDEIKWIIENQKHNVRTDSAYWKGTTSVEINNLTIITRIPYPLA